MIVIKKFFLSFILAVLLLLSSCSSETQEKDYYDRDYPVLADGCYNSGFLYEDWDDDMIKLFDYESRTLMPFCAVPNCLHKDSGCLAVRKFDPQHFLFIYHGKLYDISSDMETGASSDAIKIATTVTVSDTDGNNEQLLAKFDGDFEENSPTSYIFGGSLYFVMREYKNLRKSENASTPISYSSGDYADCKFMKLRLENGELTEICTLVTGYNTLAAVKCFTPHNAYFSTSYCNETAEYEDFDSVEEWIEASKKIKPIEDNCTVNLENKEKTDEDKLPINVEFVYDSHYFSCGYEGVYIYDTASGKFKKAFDMAGYECANVIDDKYAVLLKDETSYLYDIEADKITQLPDYANVQMFSPEVFYGDYCFGSIHIEGDTDDYFLSGYGYCKTDDMYDKECEFTLVYSSEIGLG